MLRLNDLSWQEAENTIKTKDIILPVGALEAHGPHLPVGTDNYISQKLAETLAGELDGLLLPLLPLGQVWSLQNFPGSISLQNSTLISLIKDIAVSLTRQGAKLLIIVNGHFGNNQALKSAVRELREISSLRILIFTHPGIEKLEEKYIESPRVHPSYLHADEIETSFMLAIKENLVRMEKAVAVYPELPAYFSSYSLPWEEISPLAVLGDPTLADKEKGQQLIRGLIENMMMIIREFKEEML